MRRTVPLFAGIALLGACGSEPTVGGADASFAAQSGASQVDQDLATLRRVTTPFQIFANATAAGWSALITPCMTNPTAGGMGFHYGNPAFIDGSVQVDQPELLLYEPQEDGRLHLVAVEYIVPFTAWHASVPPRLYNRNFKRNETFQVWALHAWVWKDNPRGMFADWNPLVNCNHTTNVSTMAHH